MISVDLAALPRPVNFDRALSDGLAEARGAWEHLTPGRRALVELAAHADLEIVQARISDEGGIVDHELWLALPGGTIAAIGIRSQRSRSGNRGFSYFGTPAEQAELRAALIARLGLRGDTEPGDVWSYLTEALEG